MSCRTQNSELSTVAPFWHESCQRIDYDIMWNPFKPKCPPEKLLKLLNAMELSELARKHPASTAVALRWAHKGINDPRGITKACQNHFLRMLPRVIDEQPSLEVAHVVEILSSLGAPVKGTDIVASASRAEAAGDVLTAYRMYEAALKTWDLSEQDREAAIFRTAFLAETRVNDPVLAAKRYREILDRYPTGAFAEQAKTLLEDMKAPHEKPDLVFVAYQGAEDI